ncbi:MAG: nuclear transport factor 2 family protein [Gemmatimonadaceae bacterium]
MRRVVWSVGVLLRWTCVALVAGGVRVGVVDAQESIARRGKEPGTAESPVERTLFALEEDWTRALVRRDGTTFDRLLAPRFVYTENDQVMTKEELIRSVVAGSDTVESAGNEDMRAYVYGNTAVVTGWLVVRGRGPSGAFNRRFRYTDTWLYRDGRWRVIAAHDYLVPERR